MIVAITNGRGRQWFSSHADVAGEIKADNTFPFPHFLNLFIFFFFAITLDPLSWIRQHHIARVLSISINSAPIHISVMLPIMILWRTSNNLPRQSVQLLWWFFSHLQGFWGKVWQFIPHLHFFLFFLFFSMKWRLAHAHQFHFLGQDQSTVALRAETTVAESSLWACFPDMFPH